MTARTKEGNPCQLTRTQPGSMRDLAIMWMETHYAPFGDLVHTIRTGQPAAEHLYGQPFFGWLSGQPEQAARFTGAMANLTDGIKAAAIPSLPLDGARTVVDVGGADGAMLAAVLAGRPGLRGVLFDLPPHRRRHAQGPGRARRGGPGEDQWHDLLSTAGFTGIGIRETGTPLSVIHATVAG